MPIRTHESAQSQTFRLEKEWFSKAEIGDDDISRFSYLSKADRINGWTHKIDLNDSKYNLNDKQYTIEQYKFVNRPDAIAHQFYGNSKYWWLIAMRNNITDPFYEFYKGRTLMIPDLIASKKLLGF